MNKIESVKNPFIKQIKRLQKRKQREKEGLFVIEGYHLVEEALHHAVEVQDILVTDGKSIPTGVSKVNVTLITSQVAKEISTTATSQGIFALCHLPQDERFVITKKGSYLLIDGVQDPGNLGTMIRTADAAGVTAVILGEGTVDVYNDKVIRATQGSLFHLPVIKGDLEEWIQACKDNRIPVFGTSLQQGTTYTAIEAQDGFALIVGNEGAGVDEKWLEQTDQNVYVPIYGNAESLNVSVASGILLYHLKLAH
ncbi:RNA methyltransferase, TrmH family [Alteribacillus persepolensis]|uniref:RNA methyltransferase, TrmH family n=1 Tax=Alteribacillus persepolensis TaxID=568899 RepID=A0A1G8BLW2_9BACI|nr:RNA methyltransferase [Alteribacillus persepolensis]SDH34161.1 RNA methyltransferase, TrmH family [Alteribacillus persepolensis]